MSHRAWHLAWDQQRKHLKPVVGLEQPSQQWLDEGLAYFLAAMPSSAGSMCLDDMARDWHWSRSDALAQVVGLAREPAALAPVRTLRVRVALASLECLVKIGAQSQSTDRCLGSRPTIHWLAVGLASLLAICHLFARETG